MIISPFMRCALLSIAQGLAFLQLRFINTPLFFFMEYIPNPQMAAYILQCVSIICGVWIIDNALKSDESMVKYSFIFLAISNMFSSTNKLYEIVKKGNFSYAELFFVSTCSMILFILLFGIKHVYHGWRIAISKQRGTTQ